MASILQILRRIGGAKAAPTTGKAGELALWKAGTGVTDLRALYAHDGTQWVPLVDQATEALPGVAAVANDAEVKALTIYDKMVTPGHLGTVIKERLFANRNYYVRADGNDANDGLANTPAGAFREISKAIVKCEQLDLNGFNAIINVADGSYGRVAMTSPILNGNISIVGNVANPQNVAITSTSGAALSVSNGSIVSVSGISAHHLTGTCIESVRAGNLIINGNIRVGPTSGSCIYVGANGSLSASASVLTIDATSCRSAFFVQSFGSISLMNMTINVASTLTVSDSFVKSSGGSIASNGSTYSGTVTGSKYLAMLNGIISTAGAGVNLFPGTTPGTTNTGGQYV